MNGKSALIIDRDACMECGSCSQNCPAGAISVQSGVGCAAAVINSLLGRNGGECCCGPQAKEAGPGRNYGCCP
jgi:Fe-S-cluster-containing hydrogenase component 2